MLKRKLYPIIHYISLLRIDMPLQITKPTNKYSLFVVKTLTTIGNNFASRSSNSKNQATLLPPLPTTSHISMKQKKA